MFNVCLFVFPLIDSSKTADRMNFRMVLNKLCDFRGLYEAISDWSTLQ